VALYLKLEGFSVSKKIGEKQLADRRLYPSPSFLLTIVIVTLFSAFFYSQSVSAAQVTLAWDPNNESDLIGYKLYYKTGTSGPPYDGTGATDGDSPVLLQMENLTDPTNPEYTIYALDETATYFFTITACNGSGNESGYSNEVSYTPLNQPPMASFTVNPASGQAPVNVVFDATASNDPDGTIESYSWVLGDGTSGESVITSHEYASAGIYTVTLTLTDDLGAMDTATGTIEVMDSNLSTLHVGDLDARVNLKGKNGDRWEVFVTALVLNENFEPVRNATVIAEWSDSASGTPSAMTKTTGTVNFRTPTLSDGDSITFTVIDVEHEALIYDPMSNEDLDGDSDGNSLTVFKY
jgi:PKD repeat protein